MAVSAAMVQVGRRTSSTDSYVNLIFHYFFLFRQLSPELYTGDFYVQVSVGSSSSFRAAALESEHPNQNQSSVSWWQHSKGRGVLEQVRVRLVKMCCRPLNLILTSAGNLRNIDVETVLLRNIAEEAEYMLVEG